MNKILVISDSHGKSKSVCDLIEKSYDLVLFLGDGLKDLGTYENLSNVYCVKGNCDIFAYDKQISETLFVCGHKILITHGHEFKVKYGLELIEAYAKKNKYNVVCFGHTHNQLKTIKDGILYINPGALGAGKYAEIKIHKNGKIDGSLLTL